VHATSFEDIQRIKTTEGIPRWKQAALRAQALRADPPTAAAAAAWNALDAQTDPEVGKAPLSLTTGATGNTDLLLNASWLRWRILAENADARYSFAYAMDLGRMRNSEGNFDQEATIFLFHAKLALTLDGMRCTDRTKAEHLQTWYATLDRLQPVTQKAARMPRSEKSAAILEAITMEEMLGERPAMGWLCPRRASDAETKAPPRFLSDPEWRKYRTDLLEQLTRDAIRNL
jgi:rRNA maturation protein Nop10